MVPVLVRRTPPNELLLLVRKRFPAVTNQLPECESAPETVSGADSHSGSWFVTAGNLFLTNNNNSFGGVLLTSTGTIINVASLSDYGVNSAIGNRAASSETNVATDSVTNGIGIHITGG